MSAVNTDSDAGDESQTGRDSDEESGSGASLWYVGSHLDELS